MLPLAAIAVGALIGFVGSRKLRRPQHVAQAASVARTVGGAVPRRKTLTAPELQRACFSEMVRHVRVDRQGRGEAPGRYLLQVAAVDMEVIEETRSWFVDGLDDALQTAARDNGWTITGKVEIRFEVDPSRRAGVPNAVVTDPSAPAPRSTAPSKATRTAARSETPGSAGLPAALVRTDTGQRFDLGTDMVTVGRSSESTIVVDDTRVSRSHATVQRGRTGWTVTDVGSSNGTRVNGTALPSRSAQLLAVGDVIGVGPVDLRVEADAASPPAGTRALGDRDRTRISGEVLPPPRRPRS